MTIHESFFVERQGKRMVLFAGLLEEAHERFDKGFAIKTEIVQIPAEANDNVAVVKAEFEGLDSNGKVTKTSDVGDASPANVSRNIAPHVLRMASTRAKARALRDAINVGVTAMEELGGEDEGDQQSQPPKRQKTAPAAAPKQQVGDLSSPPRASEAQLKRIGSLADEVYGSVKEMQDTHLSGHAMQNLKPDQANKLIGLLQSEKEEAARKAEAAGGSGDEENEDYGMEDVDFGEDGLEGAEGITKGVPR